jgi:hypothetical protein
MSITALAVSGPHVSSDPCERSITHLVLRCAQGDEAALGDLFDLTFFLVAAIVNRAPISSTGVDDEIVEAFRRIWCQSPAYEPAEQKVIAWLVEQVLAS